MNTVYATQNIIIESIVPEVMKNVLLSILKLSHCCKCGQKNIGHISIVYISSIVCANHKSYLQKKIKQFCLIYTLMKAAINSLHALSRAIYLSDVQLIAPNGYLHF